MIRRGLTLPALLVLLTGYGGLAHAQWVGGLANVVGETDAENFTAVRVRAGGLFDYTSPMKYLGVTVQTSEYSQSGWKQNVSGVVGLWRNQASDSLVGVDAEFGVVKVGGRTRALGDVTLGLRPALNTGVEFLASAGLVETQAAIKQGTGHSFWGVTVEQALTESLTAIALAGYQPFSDGNDRTHLRARLVWDALPNQGLNLQARWRQYRSSKTDVGGAYFDPEKYQQWLALVGFRKRFPVWTASGALGAGRETIRSGETMTKPSSLAELRIERALTGDAKLAMQASYNRSAGFSNSPDYWYALLGANLVVVFK